MKRSSFMKSIGAMAVGLLLKNQAFSGTTLDEYPELSKHKIEKADILALDYHWPRFVGRNGSKDVHGATSKDDCSSSKNRSGS
jgi:hypothetical protein